jgi:hypothetical protein
MTIDVSSQVSTANLTGGNTTADRTDISVPIGDLITVDNNILNGEQDAEALRFAELGAAPSTPASGKWKAYFKSTGLFVIDDAGVETLVSGLASLGFITKTAEGSLSNEFALGSLATGLLKNTTTTGVPTIAAAGTDYQAPIKIAIIQDQKANNTDGGGSSATTWNARALNTEVYDPGALVTISSNKFTPIAGTYKLRAEAPGYKCAQHRLRLYNVTGAAVVDQGVNAHSSTADTTQTLATLETVFTANGTNEYRIDHYTVSAQATNGLGNAVNSGDVERYCTVTLEKIG